MGASDGDKRRIGVYFQCESVANRASRCPRGSVHQQRFPDL